MTNSWTAIFAIAAGFWIVYLIGLAIHRLYLSPVAKIPGPKLAVLTFWYEFYYDVVKQGQYTWKIAELHRQYGPILRINPYEVHINDPDYYNEIYAGPSKRRDRWAWTASMLGNSSSHFGAVPHDLHRHRRAPLNPFFSRASVHKLEPMIKNLVQQLCSGLEEVRQNKEPVNLGHAFGAVTMDVITEYAFGTSYECLHQPDFAPTWGEAIDALTEQSHRNKQMPWILGIMRLTPLWIVKRMNPQMMGLIKFQMDMKEQVTRQMNSPSNDDKFSAHPTIFHTLLQPGVLPPEQQTVLHLIHEAQAIVAAGQITTMHYLRTTAYHIIANPDINRRLKAELNSAMPDGGLPSLQRLEQLPFLTACVLEGYRISYGLTHRLQRVSPEEALIYKDYVIPPGTPMSMTSVMIHDNEQLFPKPRNFEPERWTDPKAREKLSNYLVNFSKGTRSCLGKELANAEIYFTLAAVFSRFDFELYKTTRDDIDVAHDFFSPQARKGSLGLRVVVH